MDPPTSSSSHSKDILHYPKAKPQNEKAQQQQNPTTPKTTNTTESYPSRSEFTTQPQTAQPPPLHRSRNAAKIIKGEIHNVLTVMRSDPRYYSTGDGGGAGGGGTGQAAGKKKRIQSRFEYEERQQHTTTTTAGRARFWAGVIQSGGSNNDWKTNNDARSGTISSHPILQGLRDLHDLLSVVEVEGNSIIGSSGGVVSSQTKSQMNAVTFVTPFAAAVRSSDVDAKTTGEALSALHKFIVYGFIGGHDEEYDTYFMRFLFTSSSDKIRESISVVAQCIRHCSFENRNNASKSSSATPKGMFSFWSRDGMKQRGSDQILGQSDSTVDKSNSHELPSFLVQPRRTQKSTGKGSSNDPNSNRRKPYSSLSPSDEDVVLKLLSLSVQVLRCPAGRKLLSPGDVVGIFDTCLHVAIAAGEAKRSLLRSAAADALSHCVIVVFGMRGQPSKKQGGSNRNGPEDDDTDDPTNEDDATDSDDDWGERDPTEEDPVKDILLVGKSTVKSDSMQKQDEVAKGIIDVNATTSSLKGEENCTENDSQEEEPALVAIMHRLATLADPLLHEDDTCVLALSLVNIALETMSDVDALSVRYPRLLSIMQNDLCRNLLRLSTSTDLTILGLSLRVIFNLFNSIKDHLKVQLEVFLTSVHLRILSFSTNPTSKERVWSSSPERRELGLESLLEFCREPMLMADVYLNYDCDIACSNLFETICSTLAKVANPEDENVDQSDSSDNSEVDKTDDDEVKPTRLNILNRLAMEGLLAVIDGIARRCRASSKYEGTLSNSANLNQKKDILLPSPPDSGNTAFLGNTLYINNDSSVNESGSMNESEYDFCNVSTSTASRRVAPERCDSEMSEHDIEWLSKARYHTSLALRERKLRKRRMAKAAVEFNERSRDKEWIEEAERYGVLPTPATPSSVASFLYSTPKLDKAKIGLYLSKGPKEKYPFNSLVLEKFASLFDFSGMTFSEALRTFLGRFRLPGEAQCIDRLMESFAGSLVQQLSGTVSDEHDQSVEVPMLDPPRPGSSDVELSGLDPPAASDEADPVFPFASSDAAFILSFSTIMLNTDLHNPNMKDEKRMTLDQFIRNNRGINDGKDLPELFLTDLYHEIKNEEIQVKQDLLQDGVGGADAFDGLLAKASDVATPFFTSNRSAQQKIVQAGVHERDMFVSISSAAINAISTIFVESWDDVLVTKALDGLRNSAYICSYFGLDEQFNQILELLLGFGLDYVGSVTTLMYTTEPVGRESGVKSPETELCGLNEDNEQTMSDLEAELVSRDIPRLPKSFLLTLNANQDAGNQTIHFDICDMAGSAAHRGLLSLQSALTLGKHHLSLVSEAWPMFLDVIFALRDVKALPPQLSEMDDFADSRGANLPMSVFAHASQHRVNKYMESIAPPDKLPSNRGFLSSFFGFGQSSTRHDEEVHDRNAQTPFPLSDTLQRVAHCAQLDKIIMKTPDVAMAKRILCAMLGSIGDEEEITSDPLFEHNSVFVLELAARLLFSNRVHAAELYPIFFAKFQHMISKDDSSGCTISELRFPYILERIVVTILRACIHLFDVPDACLRDQLNRSLNLIAMLPSSYTRAISDRIGCGAAIILRGCFYLFDDSSDGWSTIKCLLDLAAQDKSGRGFVFDGIASVIDSIDYAIPSTEDGVEGHIGDESNNEVQLSQCGVEVMASLLLKFMNGSYEEDLSFKVPSMMYIKKVYSFSQHFSDGALADSNSASSSAHLQDNEFETMVTAIYNDACLSQDGVLAKKGFESLQGIVLSTKVDALPVAKWFTFLQLVATNPPDITSQEARISSLSLIGRLFLTLMPELSNQKENWSELEDWTICVASIVSENLQAGRATPLFETTVQTVTNVVNVVSLSGFNQGDGVNFCAWVGETLLYELEKIGASGGATSMMAAARGNGKHFGKIDSN
ncbi:hypothetical protein ACHAXR_009956 [Thalassiosira sp. AJA248-18]